MFCRWIWKEALASSWIEPSVRPQRDQGHFRGPFSGHCARCYFPPETPFACRRCLAPVSFLIDHHQQVQLYNEILRK